MDAQDWRALSLLEVEQPTRREVVGGVAFVVAFFVFVPSLAVLSALLLGGMQSLFGGGVDDLPPPPLEVVETRFVRLGKKRNPKQLPSMDVAAEQAAPTPEAPSSEPIAAVPPVPIKKKEKGLTKRDKNEPEEDLLAQLGERAGAISDMTKGPELEGDPDGIAEGTKATGDEEDIYLGKLYAYFRRGWQVPSMISDEEVRTLACVIDLSVTNDGKVGAFEVTRSSGNEAFDESVLRRMSQVEDAPLPAPPDSIAQRILGKTISLRFFGRHVR